MIVPYGTQSGKQLSSLIKEKGTRFKWWHQIDVPIIQILTADESTYAELFWPERVRYRGSPAVGECEDGEFKFKKASGTGSTISILQGNTETEVGQISIVIGKPSTITLSNGHGYSLRNEGFLKEEWVLVDENEEALFRVKRVFPDIQVSGEVELLGEGVTQPPLLLLMMAAWYVIH